MDSLKTAAPTSLENPPVITPGEVIRLEGLDLPQGARFHYFTRDNVKLRAMIAPSPREHPRGSVILCPGRSEFIEKYFEVTFDLQRRGFTVLIVDPRGQGLSDRLLPERLKSHVASFDDYGNDLAYAADLFKEELPKPHILMGHSMGGLIILQTVLSGKMNPSACIASAPMLAVHDMNTPILPSAIRLFSWLGMAKSALPFQGQRQGLPPAFKFNKLTSDPNRFQLWATYFENHKRLRVGPPTYGWICEALKAMKFVNNNAEHLKIDTLIAAAGADAIVVPASNEDFAKRAGADYINVAGARHELMIEADEYRYQFWKGVDDFLEKYGL